MAYTTIDDPSAYFHTRLYTSNNGELAVTNNANSGDFQPDWIWIKDRGASNDHILSDTSRGITKRLESNTSDAEGANSQDVKSVQSNGFTVGNNAGVNAGTSAHVAWQWKANGGTTASNDDGNLTTTIQVNQTAGFSIVLWTSTGSSDTIGHGLGATPTVIIEKSRSAGSTNWTFYTSVGGNKLMFLNNQNAVTTSFSGVSNVGSSIFTDGNGGTDTRVAYCFAPKQGYSKFGIFTGNGNADGPFVYTGFKPAWIMVKNLTDSGDDWHIHDLARGTYNANNKRLKAKNETPKKKKKKKKDDNPMTIG